MGLLRDLSDADRSQYDKYSRPKAANVRRAPIKNAASDVGGTTAEELVRARLSTYGDNPAYGPQVGPIPERSAPPGLGQTDIVRGKPRREERREARAARSASRKNPTYNPGKGDIGIKGSFDRDYIDEIISGVRDNVKNFGSQSAAKERRQDAKDIKSVLDILESKGIGTGPSPRENLAAEREIDPIIDYRDPDRLATQSANYADVISQSLGAAGSPTTAETLFNFGFGPDPNAPDPEPQPEPKPKPEPEPEPEPEEEVLMIGDYAYDPDLNKTQNFNQYMQMFGAVPTSNNVGVQFKNYNDYSQQRKDEIQAAKKLFSDLAPRF